MKSANGQGLEKAKSRKELRSRSSVKSKLSSVFIVMILFVGLGLILYPTISDKWNSYHQSRAINNYIGEIEKLDPEVCKQMLEEAYQYNKDIKSVGLQFRDIITGSLHERYLDTLNLAGDGTMGYIEIPKISVQLPIKHTTSENVLQNSIGHIEGTSLPVGGENTHAVLSGHRGLPSAKLFTDLDDIEVGDAFMITILNQKLTYEVDQIRIVLPEETDNISAEPGKDYCTLVTCTPYGINSHRILVRGHRIANEEYPTRLIADGVRFSSLLVAICIAVPMIIVGMIIISRPTKRQ